MKLTIKSKPEDFIVREIADLPLKKRGNFGVYLLQKQGLNTADVLRALSRKVGIPSRNFAYGGRKDRHAFTFQNITIRGPKIKPVREKDYTLDFLGFMERPMGPDLIQGNSFEAAVRKLLKPVAEKAVGLIPEVEAFGFPNYFDDQRFGSFDAGRSFLAEKLLREHYNGALKIYLAGARQEDKREVRERKQYFSEHWKNWSECRRRALTSFEKQAFDFLDKHSSGFLSVLKQIPGEELSLYLSAYQAYIWNEMVRRLIREKISGPFKAYPGIAGEYIFYTRLNDWENSFLEGLEIPTPSAKVKITDEAIAEIYARVLGSLGIKNSLFNKLKVRQAFFKSSPRKVRIKPLQLTWNIKDDELNEGKMKLCLTFRLPRGSYGTMFIKRLFSAPEQ